MIFPSPLLSHLISHHGLFSAFHCLVYTTVRWFFFCLEWQQKGSLQTASPIPPSQKRSILHCSQYLKIKLFSCLKTFTVSHGLAINSDFLSVIYDSEPVPHSAAMNAPPTLNFFRFSQSNSCHTQASAWDIHSIGNSLASPYLLSFSPPLPRTTSSLIFPCSLTQILGFSSGIFSDFLIRLSPLPCVPYHSGFLFHTLYHT